jgi:hypothetical protein
MTFDALAAGATARPWVAGWTDEDQITFLMACRDLTLAHGDASAYSWVVQNDSDPNDLIVTAFSGNGPRAEANAALIVLAVNNIEQVVAALRALVEKWEAGEAPSAFYNEFTQARAALALLNGEKP